MGFRFSKSLKLPGGFRVNLSTRGVGTSWGVKGFRVGVGPSGPRVHVGIPGTGIGWSSGGGAGRRVGASSATSYRQLAAGQREAQKLEALQRNQYEVKLHDERVRALVSLHREGWAPWDWQAVASTPAPQAPPRNGAHEMAASRALATYQPGLLDKLLGAERKRQALAEEVSRARLLDEQAHTAALAAHQLELQRWQWLQRVAQGVLAGNPEACQTVLDQLGPFETFQTLGSTLNVCVTQDWCVEAWLTANDRSVVPEETVTLTATGKLSRRAMPKAAYWSVYQDHVCSASLRVAREIFALLPIPVVLVHRNVSMTVRQIG